MNVLTTDTPNEQTVQVGVCCNELKTIWEHQNRYEFFGMLHAKFDNFEICVFVMPNLVTIYQRVLPIAENKLDIGRQKLMGVD